jgi:SAM-dependent methyltransferase
MTGAGDRLHTALVHDRRVERLTAIIAALLPRDANVVDVGAGDGLLASRLLERRPDIRIKGLDVLPREETHVPVELFDGARIPLPDDGCDVVLLVDVLHHADDAGALLAECARVAKQAVVVKDHLREGFAAGPTLAFMDWMGNARHGVRLTYRYFTRAVWGRLIERTGLTAVRWEERLALYPAPADWVFGRKLHFVASLSRTAPEAVAPLDFPLNPARLNDYPKTP